MLFSIYISEGGENMKTIVLVAIFTICYVVCMDFINKYMSNIQFESNDGSTQIVGSSNIYSVSISGEVVNPGTYTVTRDSTMSYLITLAGGLSDKADVTCFNSNALLENGGDYYISFISVDENNKSTKVSLNSANQASLDTLPGIGEVFSKRIIDYRVANNGFKTIEDLKKVQGIGDNLFNSLKDLVCL